MKLLFLFYQSVLFINLIISIFTLLTNFHKYNYKINTNSSCNNNTNIIIMFKIYYLIIGK